MIPATGWPPSRTERGSGAVELVLTTALILIPMTMLLLSLPLMVAYRTMGDAAAREAVRACANALDPSSGQQRAESLARRILGERGLSPQAIEVIVDCRAGWEPGAVVSATVSFRAPVIDVVGIGSLGTVTFSRSYRERIKPYRSWP
ncbi:MAG: hypothetical protein OXS29_00885 [bacterium]|nr:hypothetical protein [bacterium]